MMHHIRPHQLFSHLGQAGHAGQPGQQGQQDQQDNLAQLLIPTIPGRESLTVFSLETLLLVAAARITRSQTILEIGTSLGYTALHFAMNTPASTRITTVDIEKKPAAFEGTKWEDRITRLTGDTTQIAPSPQSMVFIDADHSYKWVKQDTHFAFSCSPRVVCWHDYCRHYPGVVRWLTKLSHSRELFWVEDSWLVFWFAEGVLPL